MPRGGRGSVAQTVRRHDLDGFDAGPVKRTRRRRLSPCAADAGWRSRGSGPGPTTGTGRVLESQQGGLASANKGRGHKQVTPRGARRGPQVPNDCLVARMGFSIEILRSIPAAQIRLLASCGPRAGSGLNLVRTRAKLHGHVDRLGQRYAVREDLSGIIDAFLSEARGALDARGREHRHRRR